MITRISIVVFALSSCVGFGVDRLYGADPRIIPVWPDKAPGETKDLPPEGPLPDNKPIVAGKPITLLANVSTPTLAVYKPEASIDTGRSVIICPGGGHYILAYDLEGTEVADWLNRIGITAILLKYRVPGRDPENKSLAAVQDAQRSVSLVRSMSKELGIDPDKIGVLGFSAGGEVAARASFQTAQRLYPKLDSVDEVSMVPNFAILVYPAYLVSKDETQLLEGVTPSKNGPTTFMVHAFDDPVTPQSCLLLASALKRAAIPFELHIYPTGGHGYGLRHFDGAPVTDWPTLCETWLKTLK